MTVLATALWLATYPDTALHDFAYKTMLYAGVSTVFFNINPLIKIDGYFAMTDLLGIPTCARTPSATSERSSSGACCGCRSRWSPLPRRRADLPGRLRHPRRVVGAVSSCGSSATSSSTFYSKVLPDFALLLTLATLFHFFRKRVNGRVRACSGSFISTRRSSSCRRGCAPPSSPRPPRSCSRCSSRGRAVRSGSEILLQPGRTLKIQAHEDGVVTSVKVCEGDAVREGDVLLVLSSLRRSTPGSPCCRPSPGASRRVRADLMAAGDARGCLPRPVRKGGRGRRARGRAGPARPARGSKSVGGHCADTPPRRSRGALREGRDAVLVDRSGDCRSLMGAIPVTERLLTDLAPGQIVLVQLRGRPFPALRGRPHVDRPRIRARLRAGFTRRHPSPFRPSRAVSCAIATFDNAGREPSAGLVRAGEDRNRRASLLAAEGSEFSTAGCVRSSGKSQ